MTINGLKNTIRYDEDVFSWALCLLGLPHVQEQMPLGKLNTIKRWYLGVLAFDLAVISFIIITISAYGHGISIIGWILGLFLIRCFLDIPIKTALAETVCDFISSNMPKEDLEKITLLQLSVLLNKRFNAPDLVDTFWDNNILFFMGMLSVYTVITWMLSFDFITWINLLLLFIWLFHTILRIKASPLVIKVLTGLWSD